MLAQVRKLGIGNRELKSAKADRSVRYINSVIRVFDGFPFRR